MEKRRIRCGLVKGMIPVENDGCREMDPTVRLKERTPNFALTQTKQPSRHPVPASKVMRRTNEWLQPVLRSRSKSTLRTKNSQIRKESTASTLHGALTFCTGTGKPDWIGRAGRLNFNDKDIPQPQPRPKNQPTGG